MARGRDLWQGGADAASPIKDDRWTGLSNGLRGFFVSDNANNEMSSPTSEDLGHFREDVDPT